MRSAEESREGRETFLKAFAGRELEVALALARTNSLLNFNLSARILELGRFSQNLYLSKDYLNSYIRGLGNVKSRSAWRLSYLVR